MAAEARKYTPEEKLKLPVASRRSQAPDLLRFPVRQ
jgi:hypothetical protein